MIKKIIARFILIFITTLLIICGYYLLIDIQSYVPNETVKECNVETKEFMSRKVFILTPKNEQKSNKVILYFHGGAYVAEATNEHWKFIEQIVKDTNATVIMPDYPLTPKYYYEDVFNMVEPLYKEIIEKIEDKNLIMMGDSAGGGIAIALAEKISSNNIKLPHKTILLSPWLDVKMENKKIEEVQKNDTELNKETLKLAGISYARTEQGMEDYLVNPINGPLKKLENIIIYTGTYDILNPDTHLLQEKAKSEGVDIKLKEYDKAQHIWIVNNINKNNELANKAYKDLLDDLLN